jgi:pimeloyl-ACP methyl ester carboxylesterase
MGALVKRVLKFFGWLFGAVLLLVAGIVAHANYLIGKNEVDSLQAHAPGKFLTVEGMQQHFLTVGDIHADPTGAPIMVIHGFIASGHMELMPWAAEKLGARRALILPDLMGYGFSQRRTIAGDWSAPGSHARYLADMLDQLGIARVDLIGHSYGGAMAARFALDYPERVRKVVYLNPGLYVPKSKAEVVIELPLGIGRALTYHFLGNGPKGIPAQVCRRSPSCTAAWPTRIEDTTDTQRALLHYNRHSPVLDELYADILKLRTPGLILWGEDDVLLPLSVAERFARDSHSQLAVLPNAGHMAWWQKPDEVAERALRFLQPAP